MVKFHFLSRNKEADLHCYKCNGKMSNFKIQGGLGPPRPPAPSLMVATLPRSCYLISDISPITNVSTRIGNDYFVTLTSTTEFKIVMT